MTGAEQTHTTIRSFYVLFGNHELSADHSDPAAPPLRLNGRIDPNFADSGAHMQHCGPQFRCSEKVRAASRRKVKDGQPHDSG